MAEFYEMPHALDALFTLLTMPGVETVAEFSQPATLLSEVPYGVLEVPELPGDLEGVEPTASE